MRLFALLIVGLIATAPTAMAEPSEWGRPHTWKAVFEDSPLDQAGGYAEDKAYGAAADPFSVFDVPGEAMGQASRSACWTGHYVSPEAYEFAKEQDDRVAAYCEEHIREEDRKGSFDGRALAAALSKDFDQAMVYVAMTYDFVEAMVFDLLGDS